MPREERTEKATPKHRKRAREKGQVARSHDLSGSLVVLAGLFTLAIMGPRVVDAGAVSVGAVSASLDFGSCKAS